MFSTQSIFHTIDFDTTISKPKQFTFPFSYQPHIWVEQAAQEVQEYLEGQTDFEYAFGYDEVSVGKMFGVLIVENSCGELGYLAAFSGKIADRNQLLGFVPPVYDVLDSAGFFKIGEERLNQMNQKIQDLELNPTYINLKDKIIQDTAEYQSALNELKQQHKRAKEKRKIQRQAIVSYSIKERESILKNLEDESKKHHFELKDLKKKSQQHLVNLKKEIASFEKEIQTIKEKRKSLSADLQHQIHSHFIFYNGKKQKKSLLDIFEPLGIVPPAGSGECAAPRLLQYAFKNNYKPIAIGEFWWGKSPNGVIRKAKNFYPACKSKCYPILGFMLQGLDVAPNPISPKTPEKISILWEDEYLLIVDKPHNLLSVPGKTIKNSLQTVLQKMYPKDEIALVHRLDMATSGLVIVAKSISVYKKLQEQFTQRKVQKTYTALLDGILQQKNGKIVLPLRVDLDNRPTQMVCYEHGKEAVTHFQVVGIEEDKTRILFYPITGRTHQLRMHAAHRNGLNLPITGDILYGKKADRLCLHATEIKFTHPITSKKIEVTSNVPF